MTLVKCLNSLDSLNSRKSRRNRKLVEDRVNNLRQQIEFAHIAQSVEHFLGKEEATGSNPVVSTRGRCCTYGVGAAQVQV